MFDPPRSSSGVVGGQAGTHVDRTVTSLLIWIGVPLIVGIGTSLRREVK